MFRHDSEIVKSLNIDHKQIFCFFSLFYRRMFFLFKRMPDGIVSFPLIQQTEERHCYKSDISL